MTDRLSKTITDARRASVPLVLITTPDPASVEKAVVGATTTGAGALSEAPKLTWDIVRGVRATRTVWDSAAGMFAGIEPNDPVGILEKAQELPKHGILFIHNAHRILADTEVMQAVWNLRDSYKSTLRMLVLLACDGSGLPEELKNDCIVIDDPLPNDEELREAVSVPLNSAHKYAAEKGMEFRCTPEMIANVAGNLRGVSRFAAEQLAAMSCTKSGVDYEVLRTQAFAVIEQTQGLFVDRGSETFDDIGGLKAVKDFGRALFNGPRPPRVVVRIEEMEKVMQGAKTDLSGTSGDALQVILSSMEDYNWRGMIAYGAPGAGKSLYSKSLANTFSALPLRFDINATKGSLVGQSEGQIRSAMKVIHTIGGSEVFFVASVNGTASMPAELQRRFNRGTWFFDTPEAEDREEIWNINRGINGLEDRFSGDDMDFTGADIRNICAMAYDLGISQDEAINYLVPMKVQSPDALKDARRWAAGRFLCASRGGTYQADRRADAQAEESRQVELA